MTESEIAEPLELPRGIALAWGIAAAPQRGPKREMSVERIVDAAVELADADGLAAVSMAAVASKLGFTPMSLYRYVSAKDDLLLLMQEEALGLPPESLDEANGWRARLAEVYRGAVEVYQRHPWLLALPISGSPITPNSSAWIDATLQALAETVLTYDERIATSLTVMGQARWCGTVQAGYGERARTSGLDDAQMAAQESALFDAVIGADEFPELRRAIDAGVFTSTFDPFRFGLERVLDGVDAYIATQGADAAPEASGHEWIALEEAELAGDKRYLDALKAVRAAEKALRAARKVERQTLREANERIAKARAKA